MPDEAWRYMQPDEFRARLAALIRTLLDVFEDTPRPPKTYNRWDAYLRRKSEHHRD